MSIVLVISSLVLVSGITLSVFGKDSDIRSLGALFAFLSLFFGFFMLGLVIPVDESKTEIKDFQICKTDYCYTISTRKGNKIIKDMKNRDMTKNNIEVYYVKNLNSYGFDVSDEIRWNYKGE